MKTGQVKDKVFWFLLIFAAIYIIGNIGTGSLTTWDEALYANISANVLKTGDWLILHDNGKPWFDKPPLYMWCTACFYAVFGISEFSTRLTGGIFGIATVMLVYIFVRKMYNHTAALLAALLLLAAPHYVHYAKMGMMDVMLTFFITLMVYLFWLGQDKPYLLFWSAMTLIFAYLTKGLAVVSGPVIIFLYCIFSGNLKLLIRREFVSGIFVSAVVILAWHFAQYQLGGMDSVNSYFGLHIFKRATTSLEGHTGGLNYYQKVVFNKNKPWGVIFYPAFVYIAWVAIKDKDKRAILLSMWAITVFTICTIVKTKLHWYIMPIYPALAMSAAVLLDRFLNSKATKIALVIIIIGMLIQVPVSWAFKLDLNHDVKDAALHSKKLPYVDNGTIFYFETIRAGKGNAG